MLSMRSTLRISLSATAVIGCMVLLVGINSPFGQFKAVSTAMLKIRIHELSAIAAMEEVKKSKAYGESVEEATLEHIPLKRKRMIPISK